MKNKKRYKRISDKYKEYLFITTSIVAIFFCIAGGILEYNNFSKQSKNIRDRIYEEKEIHIRTQVKAAAETIRVLRDSLNENMRNRLKQRVDQAYDMSVFIYEKYKYKYSEKEIKQIIKNAFTTPRFFNGRGYYFIVDLEGYTVLHPVSPEIEGKKMVTIDGKTKRLINEVIIKNAKKKNKSYINYNWVLPNGNKNSYTNNKTSYIRNLPFYNWIIGTGEYVKYVEKETQNHALDVLNKIKLGETSQFIVVNYKGKDLINKKKIRDTAQLNKIIKKGKGLIKHRIYSETQEKYINIYAYYSIIKDWQWVLIGYTDISAADKIIEDNKKVLYNDIYSSFITIIIFMFCVTLVIIYFTRKIKKYLDDITNTFLGELEEAIKTKNYIDIRKYKIYEYKELSHTTNKLLKINHSNLKKLTESEKRLLISNKSKDRFFSIIAHDLKNPFNSLLGILEILLEDFDELDNESRKEYINVLYRSSNKLFNLLNDLLQWANMQTNHIDVKPSNIELYKIIEEQKEILSEQASKKQINFINNIDIDTHAFADKNMISTVIRNLFSNAIKYTNQGGEIKISAEKIKTQISISIKDNGQGIDKNIIDKLFKIDEKISTLGTAEETGTGLGLILCKEFIEINKGKISVSSIKGEESTFTFTLPIA
ncbi:MAG: cache domain-containing protein [Marinifilaceae bacterium]